MVFYKRPTSLRHEFALMIGKNFRTFFIPSRNQTLDSFDIDSLGSLQKTFLFFRQTQLILQQFRERNILEEFRENRREKVTRTRS